MHNGQQQRLRVSAVRRILYVGWLRFVVGVAQPHAVLAGRAGFARNQRLFPIPSRSVSRTRKPLTEGARLERQNHEKDAEDDGIGRNQPKQGKRPRAWLRHEEHAERDR